METEQPALQNAPPTPPASTAGSRLLTALAALLRPPVLIATLALALLGWQWMETRVRMADMQQELAKRLAEGDAVAKESRSLARQNQELLQSLTAKTGMLEAKLIEAQGQQLALESMYQEFSKSRDERVLAEIEQAVSIVAQQLQLTGNVEAALITLQGVDARLARTGQARLMPLRKLINRDIERLKALPLADVPGIALRLENVIGAVDTLPLAFEQRARVEPVAKAKNNATNGGNANSASNFKFSDMLGKGYWQELGRDLWAEVKLLIRVERIDHPEPALLAPTQIFFLRENLKLRLIDARLALLQRDGRSYREDLRQSRELLERYFDTREKPVSNAIATLKGLSGADLALELPALDETLGSIRNFKLARENDKQPVARPKDKATPPNAVNPRPATSGEAAR